MANKLKYLSMNSRMGSPKIHINPATRKNRADRLTIEAIRNIGNSTLKAPALMVNNLNGIGVNPAVKMIQKFHVSYNAFNLTNPFTDIPGIFSKKKWANGVKSPVPDHQA